MAGSSGPKPFSLPGDFNEKVIILLIFVDALCKSCHGSRPAHLSWRGSRVTGKAQGTAAAITGQGPRGTRDLAGCSCLCSPRSPAPWRDRCPVLLFRHSLAGMYFALYRAVSHYFAARFFHIFSQTGLWVS